MTKHRPWFIPALVVLLLVIIIFTFAGSMHSDNKKTVAEGFENAAEDGLDAGVLSKVEPGAVAPIAIVSMMKNPKNIDTWLAHHRVMGISRFYIRLEDTPSLEGYLAEQPDVVVWNGKSTGKNEYTDKQRRQDDLVNGALKQAAEDGMAWLIHIDSDELLSGPDGVLDEVRALTENVRVFWMQNEEAKFATIPQSTDQCFAAAKFVNCSVKPDQCASYGNGKGGGRVAPDVSAHGPHRFKTNRLGAKEPKLSKLIVQHYESCDFDMYKEKYRGLAVQDRDENIPFSYYKDSIEAAKKVGAEGDEALKRVFLQYRVAQN